VSGWFSAAAWRHAFTPPPIWWWILPSGGDVNPPPWPWWQYLTESPIGAHCLGAIWKLGVVLLLLQIPFPWNATALTVFVVLYGQLQKGDALIVLDRYNIRNVLWRTILGAAGAVGWTLGTLALLT